MGKNEKYCKVKSWKTLQYFVCGEPGGIRTPDPRLRRPVLYPTELLTQMTIIIIAYFIIVVNKKRKI